MKKPLAVAGMAVIAFHCEARILDSHTDIRVQRSGEVAVLERVTLEVSERQPHSVLLREAPAGARVSEVLRNGKPEPWELVPAGGATRLRVGARGKPLANGRHVYQLAYSAAGQVRFLDYHDELRWSLPAAARITAEVTLPASVPARDIRAHATAREYQSFLGAGRAAFRSAEAATITVRFPKGVVAAPAFDYRGLVLVAIGLGLVAAVLALMKLKNRGQSPISRTSGRMPEIGL